MKNNGWYSRKTALSRTKTLAEEVCADKNIARVHRQSLQLMKMTSNRIVDSETTFGQKTQADCIGGIKKTNTTENDSYRITLHKPCIRNTINSRITEYLDD